MVVVSFGILKQQNGNSHFQNKQSQHSMKQNQENGKRNTDSVLDIVKEHSELSIDGEKIVMKKKIEPMDVFYTVRDEMERRGVEIHQAKTDWRG